MSFFQSYKEKNNNGIEHIEVEGLKAAADILVPIIYENKDINYIILVDMDTTITEGDQAHLIKIPFVAQSSKTLFLVPDESIVALQNLTFANIDEYTNQNKVAVITNRQESDFFWSSHLVLKNVRDRLTSYGIDIPFFTSMNRIVPESFVNIFRSKDNQRLSRLMEWIGFNTKDSRQVKISIISDRGIDMPTENNFIKEVLKRVPNSSGMVFDIKSGLL